MRDAAMVSLRRRLPVRVGFELLASPGLGKAAQAPGKLVKAALTWDVAGNANSVRRGGYGWWQDGELNFQDGVKIVGGGFGLAGNFAGTFSKTAGLADDLAGGTKSIDEIAELDGMLLLAELDLSRDSQRALIRAELETQGTGLIAHHLIPLEALTDFRVLMEGAAKGGFNINGANNGIPLFPKHHIGGHPLHNQAVLNELAKPRLTRPRVLSHSVKMNCAKSLIATHIDDRIEEA